MLAADSPERPTAARPAGRLSRALMRLLMKRATIVAGEWLADRFRLITLEGEALAGVAWAPGDKIQIAMGSAFVARTYTPIEWNAATGRACILAYAHGDGPGSRWVRTLAPGDECDLFGPRASIDLRRLPGPIAIFGDETAIGLAHAATWHDPERRVAACFEVDDIAGARQVATHLDLPDAMLFGRRPGDAHIAEMEAALPALAAAGATFVLAGKATTIQRLRQTLHLPAPRVATKAYWAPGKTGLD